MAREGLFNWLKARLRRSRRTRPVYRPAVAELEGRELMSLITGEWVINVHPALLPATKGQYLPVHIYGQIVSTRPTGTTAFFFVTDEYRADEPRGPITLSPPVPFNGFYSSSFDFTINLQAKRSTRIPDGRHYDIFIGAKDQDNTNGKTVAVYVPINYPVPKPVTTKTVKPKPARSR